MPRQGGLRLGLLAALLVWSPLVAAQVAVSAYIDKTVVDEGETLLFTLEITGDEPDSAVLPPQPSGGLTLMSRAPVLRERTQFGAQVQLRYGWRYRAERTGAARIGPMRLTIDGRTFTTDPIPVDIVQGRRPAIPNRQARPDPQPSNNRDLIIRAEPRQSSAVVGEQVIVDYVLYFDPAAVSPRQAVAIGTWDAPGFWREELDVPTRETYPRATTYGGRPMQAVTVRRLALFPARSGELDLAPMEYEVEVRETLGDDPFAPFFRPFSSRRSDREVTAPGTSIRVRPLPTGAPASFSGAVGEFEMVGRVEPTSSVAPGDPVRLELTVRGTGNAATLAAPEIETLGGVDAYAPQSERSVDRGQVPLRSARTFTYTFVPQGTSFEIPEIEWSYYDPDAGRFVTLREGPFPVAVAGAPAVAAAASPAASSRWQRSGGLSTGGLWALLLVGVTLPAVAGLGLVVARRGRARFARRRTPAPRDPLTAASSPREAARAADDLLRRAAASRVGTDAARLDRPGLVRAVGRATDPETAQALDHLLAASERVRFAGAELPGGFTEEARTLADRLAR